MVTTITTIHGDVLNNVPDKEKCGRITRFILRNMTDACIFNDRFVVTLEHTTSSSFPMRKPASNPHLGQTQTRSEVGKATAQELAEARLLMHDLADHILGHIVTTTLAKDILQMFVEEGFVRVYETTGRGQDTLLAPTSNDAMGAIQEAFEAAQYYECSRSNTDDVNSETSSTEKQEKRKNEKNYSFRWQTFPTSDPLHEDELVSFLNDVTDRSFKVAEPKLEKTYYSKLRHRFVAPTDKDHAIPLLYESYGENMRPDFLLLPIEAFSEDLKTVNQQYVNFTAARLVGESKNNDLTAGIAQINRYARGMKLAQPWLYYVLGLAVTRARAVFWRGEGSGTEQVELSFTDGRGCVEFIRIVLGLALADHEDLGHNPDVELRWEEATCKVKTVSKPRGESRNTTNNWIPLSELTKKRKQAVEFQRAESATVCPQEMPSTSAKRSYSEVADESDDSDAGKSKKLKPAESAVERKCLVCVPTEVYGHKFLGTLVTDNSIFGRGTTVFCVVDKHDHKPLVLRMAWQDLAWGQEQSAVMVRLQEKPRHPNVIVPLEAFKATRNGKTCTTLKAIRDFLDEEIDTFGVDNRVLTISKSELKRPVQYFWGVHDFVRGLRGALLGHEYLTSIGILHRDISENNIVLGLRPEDERGYLIDFDLAILQEAEKPTQFEPVRRKPLTFRSSKESASVSGPIDGTKPTTTLRTVNALPTSGRHHLSACKGTFPYMSYNILRGGRHTHFDDVESFLYVLFLFFFSYAGPLSVSGLREADKAGFLGSGHLSHMRRWPERYNKWADSGAEYPGLDKWSMIYGATELIQSAEFVDCLENSWPEKLYEPICSLIWHSFTLFYQTALRTRNRTGVSHAEFVATLDEWLQQYADLEDDFSNCPFKTEDALRGTEP